MLGTVHLLYRVPHDSSGLQSFGRLLGGSDIKEDFLERRGMMGVNFLNMMPVFCACAGRCMEPTNFQSYLRRYVRPTVSEAGHASQD